MIQKMIGKHKSSWHLALFSVLWAYRSSAKTATRFTSFQLIYGLEEVIPIECEIPSLKLVFELLPNTIIEEEHFLYLPLLDEHHCEDAMANESNKKEQNHIMIILYALTFSRKES